MSYCLTGPFPSTCKNSLYIAKAQHFGLSTTFTAFRGICTHLQGASTWDYYVPWAATSVASRLFSVPKVGFSDIKKDLVKKDGQKTSLKGVWREKESSKKGKHSSVSQCTKSPSSAYILPTHRLISVPESLAPCQWECRFWQFVQSAVRNCS